MSYTKITRCPECGSKHLKVSELCSQVWNDRVLRGGKLSKGKRKSCPWGETFDILSCEDCDFLLENVQFKTNEEGDIFLDDDYFYDKQSKLEELKQEEKSQKAFEELKKRGLL